MDEPTFDYAAAFSRNLGLVSPEEQQVLRKSHVAIAGMGAVGSAHLLTLARMGVGNFRIADFDLYEIHNINRQVGAMLSTLGKSKVDVMAESVADINPAASVERFHEGVTEENVEHFLEGADVALDGLDFTAVEAREIFYATAHRLGIPVIAVGPVGCSAASLVFLPGGMTWHDYFAMDLAKNDFERFVLFIVGTAPALLHRDYIDRRYVNLAKKQGPSLSLAIQLCTGVAAGEALKLLLKRGKVRAAPYYQQFDVYQGKLATGKLRWGNRGPLQRLKFWFAKKQLG